MILFGTGGIRGIMKEGEFDEKTVMVASKGVSNYMKDNNLKSMVIAYDTRNNSQKFAEISASVFAADGHKVYIFPEPVPTPALSFAVRELKCDMGIVITASHNPPEYNGYKVYTSDGVQAVPKLTDILAKYVERAWNTPIELSKNFNYLEKKILNNYVDKVAKLISTNLSGLKIVYTPLHGTGLKPVVSVLKNLGAELILVSEQAFFDGNFPTVKSPNPEDDEALVLLKEYMEKFEADLGIATDPDCDRVGVIWKGKRLTGNQVGVLITDYLLENATENDMIIKTIVTTDMVKPMCKEKNVKLFETPTGFKFIGHLAENSNHNFLFGFEESCGYLTGNLSRDKDGAVGAALIAAVSKKFDLIERLNSLYEKYGYYMEKLLTYKFKNAEIAKNIYKKLKTINFREKIIDYSKGYENIEPNETIAIIFEEGKIFIRPSGTEPKLKAYVMTVSDSEETSSKNLEILVNKFNDILDNLK
ncbi:phosphomannomutase [Thermosipho melanesiensis]|uniref:Phosphomannomutase n=2 Tax=Thermosipho melanesiensis TaxID=46541 RepID=A6LKI9_THEM4|nr:phospho-sugar mutase [Thermosipho melanesiensis]ABR30440.1 Phosphomannomutase [Thermosipho melanesiensis BI429]APT73600.1 phosphomannomutase [Thermosipho melanesiensis]OOC37547.1 phosphomannomutase [Thermosipho melanesiensis]OOC39443.1 phosphomannomutase [Thermosipho melanesiensis]OOC39506.1 phosphomannomutase [Thermosipho melanesiensis]